MVTENIADFVGIVDVSPRLSRVLTGRTTARLGDSIEETIESLRCGVRT